VSKKNTNSLIANPGIRFSLAAQIESITRCCSSTASKILIGYDRTTALKIFRGQTAKQFCKFLKSSSPSQTEGLSTA
jgi:hypothetical protein